MGTALGWYFIIWGMSGLIFAPVGPFGSERECNDERLAIMSEVNGANQVSPKCYWIYAKGVK